MTLDDIRFPSHELKMWLIERLNTQGPWHLKSSLKDKINCLLHFILSGGSAEALHIREYLCSEDSDYIWVNSMENVVLPYIQSQHTVQEGCYG